MLRNLSCLCFLILFYLTSGQKCPNSPKEFEHHLATKTAYRVVANYNASEVKYPGCEATKIWGLVRHGTRNPSPGLLEKMRTRLIEVRDLILENLTEGTDQIHNLDLDLFRSWSSKIKAKDEQKLTQEGSEEMLLLAERLQMRFPKVLASIYSDTSYKFKYTATQRTKKSAESFAAGLFGKNVVKDVLFPEPLKRDPILRFYKLCTKWSKEVKKNPETISEMKKFHSGPKVAKTIEAVNKRLGFNNQLNLIDVHSMYMTCAYETAWNKRKRSPWCSAFTIEDLQVMEYGEDLKYYWIDGYGHELTYKQACPAFSDLADFFQNNQTYPKSTMYFTHSGTLLKMLAHMGLYKPESPLVADDFDNNFNRTWRMSNIDSFGTNLVFVLFDCQGQQKVLTLHQEHIVRLPACPDQDLCDLRTFVDYYGGTSECHFDAICENPN